MRDRATKIRQHTKADALLAAHYEQTFALECALAYALAYRRNTRRLPSGVCDALFSFAVPAMRIRQKLPERAKGPFEGKLQDFVNGTFGARPLAYEIGIATHLMDKGWDVNSPTIVAWRKDGHAGAILKARSSSVSFAPVLD